MIVVEGPDGSGKTTLVNTLLEGFDIELGQRGTDNRDELYKVTRQDTYNALAQGVLGGDLIVWDRLFFSEMVYAPVVGRVCEFSDYEQIFVANVLAALQCPIILCWAPYSLMKQNAEAEHQMAGVHENWDRIYKGYVQIVSNNRQPLNWIMYDYTETTAGFAGLADVLEHVRKYQLQRREREWQ